MIWKARDTEDGVYIIIYTFTNSSQSDTLLRNISVNIDRTFQTAEGDFWFGRKVTTLDLKLKSIFFRGSPNLYFLQQIQLTFTDSQVADFLEELGAKLGGHLALLDAVSGRP